MSKIQRGIHIRYVTATAVTALLTGLITVGAAAQSGAETSVETIVITGTHIQRPNFESVSPISTVDSKEIQLSGIAESETLLSRLPQVTADANENVSNGSDGTANVNLRGLGSNRGLVLIDGQRMLPTMAVDLNFIPSALVERVDVLTGGASAVYGSDAISGVVNFQLNKRLNGIRFDAQTSIAEHTNDNSSLRSLQSSSGNATAPSVTWDGLKYNATLAGGMDFLDGKGNITVYAGYRKVDPVLQSTRDYSACALNDDGAAFSCGGSGNTAYGRFALLSGPNSGLDLSNAKDGSKTWVNEDSSFLYNYAGDNYIQRQDKRITGGGFLSYQFNDSLELYSSFMYMKDHTFSQVAASGIWLGTAFTINCDNPLMSDQQKNLLCGSTTSTGDASALIGYRMVKGAPRRDDLSHEDVRAQIGFRGKLSNAISYDVSAMQSQMLYGETYYNDVDQNRAANGLQVVTVNGVATCKSVVDGTDPDCVPIDVFSANGPSAAAYQYIFQAKSTASKQTLVQYSGNINADLGAYGVTSPWAREGVAMAFGIEHRGETYVFTADELAQESGSAPGDGKIFSDEFYAEADIPLVQDKPWVKSLSLNLGYRYTLYDAHSSTSSSPQKTFGTYKIEATYAPNDEVRFRGGYNRAVRAPNISELFTAQGQGNVSATDPCAGSSPTATLAQCALSGVTAAEYGHITECPSDLCTQQYGGNPDLKPEKAETITFGFVATPSAVPNLQLSLDYYNIRIKGYIGAVEPSVILSQCMSTGSSFYCGLLHRDHSAGGILFGTSGYVISTNVNTGFLKTSGLDVGGNYRYDLDEWGALDFSMMGTYLINSVTEPLPGLGTYDCRGLFGSTCGQPSPIWRHNLRTTWLVPDSTATISLNWRYLGGVKLSSNSTNTYLAGTTSTLNDHIADYSYFDLAASGDIGYGMTLTGGVNNVLDKSPPAIASGLLGSFGNGNTYPGVYDPMGRVLFLQLSAKY